ncbi:TIR domain-containing protein [Photobacterium iliopiscarium]|jgi:hypothetical protein|uniref:DNA-binding protein n=1 Tax=Photobacterium iliopiscarium TaxID=56192 RepID=A0A2T3MQ17_9GAMM|nr:nucleotide-binding protein [Photobacterium iliopiscarium]PSV99135.1 DNA-binding protein [Photobacterium iliopiscarium]
MTEPRIFIGSSAESLRIVNACIEILDHSSEVVPWTSIFESGEATLESLVSTSKSVDFALFVLSPDDVTDIRGVKKLTVRDNVVFELGLFIGAIGRKRCFMLMPRDMDVDFPTDLHGINKLSFKANRFDNKLDLAVSAPCSNIIRRMEDLGSYVITTDSNINNLPPAQQVNTQHADYSVDDEQFCLMLELLETNIESRGLAGWDLRSRLLMSDTKFHIAAAKLLRSSLIEMSTDSDYNGNEWPCYGLTPSGIDYVLINDNRVEQLSTIPL